MVHGHGAHAGHGAHSGHGHHHHDGFDGQGGHGHAHGGHGHSTATSTRRALFFAVLITASFMAVEVGVGFWSGSLALLADAGHMLADAGALGLALFANVIASRPRNERSTYGYRRAEVL